jgi:hypothetical protein
MILCGSIPQRIDGGSIASSMAAISLHDQLAASAKTFRAQSFANWAQVSSLAGDIMLLEDKYRTVDNLTGSAEGSERIKTLANARRCMLLAKDNDTPDFNATICMSFACEELLRTRTGQSQEVDRYDQMSNYATKYRKTNKSINEGSLKGIAELPRIAPISALGLGRHMCARCSDLCTIAGVNHHTKQCLAPRALLPNGSVNLQWVEVPRARGGGGGGRGPPSRSGSRNQGSSRDSRRYDDRRADERRDDRRRSRSPRSSRKDSGSRDRDRRQR